MVAKNEYAIFFNNTSTNLSDEEFCRENFKNKILNKIKENSASKIILSCEDMLSKNTFPVLVNYIKELGFKIKFILYIRPYPDWLMSYYSTHIRSGGMKIIKEYNKDISTYFERILPYIEKFGKENVIIKPYEKEQWKNNNLIDDFLDIFNVELPKDFASLNKNGTNHETKMNVSAGRNTIEMLRLMSSAGLVERAKKDPFRLKLEELSTHTFLRE